MCHTVRLRDVVEPTLNEFCGFFRIFRDLADNLVTPIVDQTSVAKRVPNVSVIMVYPCPAYHEWFGMSL